MTTCTPLQRSFCAPHPGRKSSNRIRLIILDCLVVYTIAHYLLGRAGKQNVNHTCTFYSPHRIQAAGSSLRRASTLAAGPTCPQRLWCRRREGGCTAVSPRRRAGPMGSSRRRRRLVRDCHSAENQGVRRNLQFALNDRTPTNV